MKQTILQKFEVGDCLALTCKYPETLASEDFSIFSKAD